jgi:hypothetical protein
MFEIAGFHWKEWSNEEFLILRGRVGTARHLIRELVGDFHPTESKVFQTGSIRILRRSGWGTDPSASAQDGAGGCGGHGPAKPGAPGLMPPGLAEVSG